MIAIVLGCALRCYNNKYISLNWSTGTSAHGSFKILQSEFTSSSACTKHFADKMSIIL